MNKTPNPMKINRSRKDLLDQFNDTILKLRKFCNLYDDGDKSMAKDISVKLRLLFHTTDYSKSLLKQVKLEHIQFKDSAFSYDPRNLMTHHGLLYIRIDTQGIRLSPHLELSVISSVSFANWWDSKKVIVDKKKNVFTRRKIVLELANTDGGAHVDSKLKEDYFNVSRANSLGWVHFDPKTNKNTPDEDPIPPCIRQIAYETLLTIENIDIERESNLKK